MRPAFRLRRRSPRQRQQSESLSRYFLPQARTPVRALPKSPFLLTGQKFKRERKISRIGGPRVAAVITPGQVTHRCNRC
jgi:hypothetical protein